MDGLHLSLRNHDSLKGYTNIYKWQITLFQFKIKFYSLAIFLKLVSFPPINYWLGRTLSTPTPLYNFTCTLEHPGASHSIPAFPLLPASSYLFSLSPASPSRASAEGEKLSVCCPPSGSPGRGCCSSCPSFTSDRNCSYFTISSSDFEQPWT